MRSSREQAARRLPAGLRRRQNSGGRGQGEGAHKKAEQLAQKLAESARKLAALKEKAQQGRQTPEEQKQNASALRELMKQAEEAMSGRQIPEELRRKLERLTDEQAASEMSRQARQAMREELLRSMGDLEGMLENLAMLEQLNWQLTWQDPVALSLALAGLALAYWLRRRLTRHDCGSCALQTLADQSRHSPQ